MTYDFVIVGAGIFGLTTAIELRKKGYNVTILNPGQIPHPLAASTDISKIIRMEYGSDTEYMEMAISSMAMWRQWNDQFKEKLYHETGYILTAKDKLSADSQQYENDSYVNLLKYGFKPEILNAKQIHHRFPVFAPKVYQEALYHSIGGYADAGRTIEVLRDHAIAIGVQVKAGHTVTEILVDDSNLATGVNTLEKGKIVGGQIIVCAGNSSSYLIPNLKKYIKITGHPVFHIKPSEPHRFDLDNFSVFAADIANTGWYGFPLHPKAGVVKIAHHGKGTNLDPWKDERVVDQSDMHTLRSFLQFAIPRLASDPVVYSRICCYTDTLDGHFWIDNHPLIKNLTVGTGGSGHGFKMGPVIGKMIAAKALGESHKWHKRYEWRDLSPNSEIQEEARYIKD